MRRDNAVFVREVMGEVFDQAIRKLKIRETIDYVREKVREAIEGELDISKFIVTKSLSRELDEYKNKQPHVQLAKRMAHRNKASAPKLGDRVPYVSVVGSSVALCPQEVAEREAARRAKLERALAKARAKGPKAVEQARKAAAKPVPLSKSDRVEDPRHALRSYLRVDYEEYVDKLKTALERVLIPVLGAHTFWERVDRGEPIAATVVDPRERNLINLICELHRLEGLYDYHGAASLRGARVDVEMGDLRAPKRDTRGDVVYEVKRRPVLNHLGKDTHQMCNAAWVVGENGKLDPDFVPPWVSVDEGGKLVYENGAEVDRRLPPWIRVDREGNEVDERPGWIKNLVRHENYKDVVWGEALGPDAQGPPGCLDAVRPELRERASRPSPYIQALRRLDLAEQRRLLAMDFYDMHKVLTKIVTRIGEEQFQNLFKATRASIRKRLERPADMQQQQQPQHVPVAAAATPMDVDDELGGRGDSSGHVDGDGEARSRIYDQLQRDCDEEEFGAAAAGAYAHGAMEDDDEQADFSQTFEPRCSAALPAAAPAQHCRASCGSGGCGGPGSCVCAQAPEPAPAGARRAALPDTLAAQGWAVCTCGGLVPPGQRTCASC